MIASAIAFCRMKLRFLGVLLALPSLAAAVDLDHRVDFDIPAQELSAALVQFSQQAHIQVIISDDLSGRKTGGIAGSLLIKEALNQLLGPSGLKYQVAGETAITISRTDTRTSEAGGAQLLRLAQADVNAAVEGAAAADGNEAATALQEVVVTGTQIKGLQNPPTPTTVLSAADLQIGGRTDLGSVLADLPSLVATISPLTTSVSVSRAGASNANLRGLGESRTLVLIDGRRPVPQDGGGTIDLNSIPLAMVDRVEIVTGGASAAYGSDAVSGVVNVIMANKSDGFHASAQYGNTTARTGSEYKIDLAYGFSFNEDRGRVIVGGNHNDMSEIGPQTSNPAYNYGLIPNPAYNPQTNPNVPQLLLRPDIFDANGSRGGLITGCAGLAGPPLPPNSSCGGLKDLTFESNGSSRPFNFGQYYVPGPFAQMSGGDVQATSAAHYINLRAPVTRDNAYGHATYDLTDNVRLKLDAYYAHSESESGFIPSANGVGPAPPFTIRSDNAFLPSNILSAMQAASLSSIQLSRVDIDWGLPQDRTVNGNGQVALGLEGKLGDGWSWDTFYSYGRSELNFSLANQPIRAALANSIDSIVGTNGQPQCRSVAVNPTCVPMNVFGYGSPSQAALDYIMGTASMHSVLNQQEASAILRGNPFATWAGPVSMAAGGEWRLISLTSIGDPISATGGFQGLNFRSLRGSDRVTEAFLETNVPLVKDLPLLKALNLNGAVRSSDYRLSGEVASWKLGVTDDLFEGLRLRFTRSRDIRAPNITELFTVARQGAGPVFDPVTNTNPFVTTFVGGNPNLRPEQAQSTTFGLVYQPNWVHGLNMSVDVFDINVTNAVTQLQPADIVFRCANGQTSLCPYITRNAQNQITQITSTYLNLNEQKTRGADFEISYPLNLETLAPSLHGRLSSRALVTYVKELSTFDGVTRTDSAGANVPYVRGVLDERYELGHLSTNLRARYVGGLVVSRTSTIDNNYIPHQLYFDLGMEYRASSFGELTIFGNVLNLQNRATPTAAPALSNPFIYDLIGRSFSVGARMSF